MIIAVPGGEESETYLEEIFKEIRTEKIPNLINEINLHIQEVQQISNRLKFSRRLHPPTSE